MIQVSLLREFKDKAIAGLRKRNYSNQRISILDKILVLDDQRKQAQFELDQVSSELNKAAAAIGSLMKSGQKDEAEKLKSNVADMKSKKAELDAKLKSTQSDLEKKLLSVPNIPHESVPEGKTPEDNFLFQKWSKELPELPNNAVPHWELAKKYNIFDLELGTKLTGAGFPVYRGKGARLQRALINFFLDQAIAAGFEEIQPPLMVNKASARGTGQLPDKEAQMYYVKGDDFYLIPTAEVPVTNIYRDEILETAHLPIKMTAYTPCFRREAGSYGAHVRGLNRVHQFDKIEVVVIEHPEKSYQTLQTMLAHVSGLLDKLELPYRILHLCGGEMGFASASTYDFEVWSAAQQMWLEVSSVSNFETFQTNRMKLRYRDADKKIQLAHTLNGSALALARIVAALIENNQTPDGIVMPEVLRKYTGFDILN